MLFDKLRAAPPDLQQVASLYCGHGMYKEQLFPHQDQRMFSGWHLNNFAVNKFKSCEKSQPLDISSLTSSSRRTSLSQYQLNASGVELHLHLSVRLVVVRLLCVAFELDLFKLWNSLLLLLWQTLQQLV